MAWKKMEGNKWAKWPTEDTPIGTVLEGPVAKLEVGKFGPMCLVGGPDGLTLVAGKAFYATVCEQDEEGVTWKIKEGDRLRVTFKELKPTGKAQPMRVYDVEIDEA